MMKFCVLISFLVFNSITNFLNDDELKFEVRCKNFIEDYKKYQAEKDLGMKSYSLDISTNGFLRYKRTSSNNRIEYFSVRLDKISEIKYLGTEGAGWIVLSCEKESVIYQTYRDAKGDVDDMISEFKFPVKGVDLDNINKWNNEFNQMKNAYTNTQK